jgi:hypothetical protein
MAAWIAPRWRMLELPLARPTSVPSNTIGHAARTMKSTRLMIFHLEDLKHSIS